MIDESTDETRVNLLVKGNKRHRCLELLAEMEEAGVHRIPLLCNQFVLHSRTIRQPVERHNSLPVDLNKTNGRSATWQSIDSGSWFKNDASRSSLSCC